MHRKLRILAGVLSLFAAVSCERHQPPVSRAAAEPAHVTFEKPLADHRVLRACHDPLKHFAADSGTGLTGACSLYVVDTQTGNKAWLMTEPEYGSPVRVLDACLAGSHWVAVLSTEDKTRLLAGVLRTDAQAAELASSFAAFSADASSVELNLRTLRAAIRETDGSSVFRVEIDPADAPTLAYVCTFSGSDPAAPVLWKLVEAFSPASSRVAPSATNPSPLVSHGFQAPRPGKPVRIFQKAVGNGRQFRITRTNSVDWWDKSLRADFFPSGFSTFKAELLPDGTEATETLFSTTRPWEKRSEPDFLDGALSPDGRIAVVICNEYGFAWALVIRRQDDGQWTMPGPQIEPTSTGTGSLSPALKSAGIEFGADSKVVLTAAHRPARDSVGNVAPAASESRFVLDLLEETPAWRRQ